MAPPPRSSRQWRKIYALSATEAARVKRWFGLSLHDWEDFTHDVFEVVLRKLPTYDPDRAPLWCWIKGIARKTGLRWRKRRRQELRAIGGDENLQRLENHAGPRHDFASLTEANAMIEGELKRLLASAWSEERKQAREELRALDHRKYRSKLLELAATATEEHYGADVVQRVRSGKTDEPSWQAYLLYHVAQQTAATVAKLLHEKPTSIYKGAERVHDRLEAASKTRALGTGTPEAIS